MELFWQCEQKVIWIGFQTNFIAISRNIIPMKLIFFSKNRSNRMMLSVWFLVFWQINHVKFNNKECAKKGFIFSLYILLAIYENVGVEQSMKRTMNKYWFFPSLFFSPYFSFVVIPFVLSVVDFFHVFQTHKMPFGIMKGKNE